MFEIFEQYLDTEAEQETSFSCQHDYFYTNEGYICNLCFNQCANTNYISLENNSRRLDKFVGIKKEIEHLNLSDEVVDIANNLFLKACEKKIHRGKYRKSIICACLFHAFIIKNCPQSYDCIIKWFNLTNQSASKGFKLVKMKLPEIRYLNENHIDISITILKQLSIKHCDKFTIFLNSDFVLKCIEKKCSRRLHIILSTLVYLFVKNQYKKDLTIEEFAKKLDYSSTILNKNLKVILIIEKEFQ